MKIYTLKTCDTCRKAIRELRENGHEPQIIDIRSDGLSATDIARFLEFFGDRLINRRSTTWRNLSEKQRAHAPAELLACHPTLMKRPVTDIAGKLYLGWDRASRQEILSKR